MAIKSGELIHVGNSVLVDRAQTAGPGNLNLSTERIYELGNYNSVATIRDTPDLTFSMESLDASAEMEALFLNQNFVGMADGTALALAESLPLDVISQFKAGRTAGTPAGTDKFKVVGSVVVPYLVLESVSYRFGLRENAGQTATLRGDSIYYAGASAYWQETTGTNTANQVIPFTNAPIEYNGDAAAGTRYALGVLLSTGRRLVLGVDYTEDDTEVTVIAAVPVTTKVRIVYQSAVQASYPQNSHAVASATRPAAIRGKDIEIRIGGNTVADRWSSIQSATAEYRVNLERDEEFGNPYVVAQEYDVPSVNGSIDLRPRDFSELMTRIRQITGAAVDEVAGPHTTVPLSLDIILHSPTDGAVLKTLYVPDARFTLPGYSGQVQQKLNVSFPWESDSGAFIVYKGARV